MSLLFIAWIYSITLVIGFFIWMKIKDENQRNTQTKLNQATDALRSVSNFERELKLLRNEVSEVLDDHKAKLDEHESKLSGLALKQGWKNQ